MDELDDYERFYENLFDLQRETFGEYDDFLDDLKELQRGGIDGGNAGSLFEGGRRPVFYVTTDGTIIPANKVKTNSQYDRLEVETYSGKSVCPNTAVDDWNSFLGPNQTDINPFTGQRSPDRIWSADGTRSIRFGDHEMDGMGTKNFHSP